MHRSTLLRPFGWMVTRRLSPEILSGILLVAATVVALAWANSPWAGSYHALWSSYASIEVGRWAVSKPLVVWVNDLLMALFFLLVGLEIKREFRSGGLSSRRRAALPMAAALGGMVVPALVYLAFNHGGPGEAGWGVPMATDIAFGLGLLVIVARSAPLALRVFLAAVAIVDDLGAILVIAFAYTSDLSVQALAAAGVFGALLFATNRCRVQRALPYAVLGLGLWYALLLSGVHATVAGVLLAFAVPLDGDVGARSETGLLHRLEHGLQPWVAFLIVPVFALANAGVTVGAAAADFLLQPVSLGIVLGLLVGKQAGILAFAWLAVRAGVAELPSGVSWRYLHGVAALCGVGFTMALFIGNLAFADPALLEQAKIAVLAASVLAAGLARVLFDVAAHHQARGEEPSRRLVARTTEADGVRPHEEAA